MNFRRKCVSVEVSRSPIARMWPVAWGMTYFPFDAWNTTCPCPVDWRWKPVSTDLMFESSIPVWSLAESVFTFVLLWLEHPILRVSSICCWTFGDDRDRNPPRIPIGRYYYRRVRIDSPRHRRLAWSRRVSRSAQWDRLAVCSLPREIVHLCRVSCFAWSWSPMDQSPWDNSSDNLWRWNSLCIIQWWTRFRRSVWGSVCHLCENTVHCSIECNNVHRSIRPWGSPHFPKGWSRRCASHRRLTSRSVYEEHVSSWSRRSPEGGNEPKGNNGVLTWGWRARWGDHHSACLLKQCSWSLSPPRYMP